MAVLGSATYKLDSDNTGLTRGLAKAERSARESSKRIAGNFAKMGAGLLTMGAGMGFALFKLGGQASDLNESINAVNVVFGEGAKTILAFSRSSSTAVGLAAADMNQLSATTGALFTNFGLSEQEAAEATIDLTKRAADLASVFNTDVKDALGALQSAVRGETEPLRRFAGDVTDASLELFLLEKGINRSVSEMTQAEKGLLRYEVAMAQTAKVEGDFRNTATSAANATRILKAQIKDAAATIGQGLLPVFEAVLPWVQSVVASFAKWAEDNPNLVRVLLLATAGVAGLALALGGLLLVAAGVVLVFGALGAGALLTVGWIGLATLAVIALVAAGVWLIKNWDKAKKSLVSVFKTVKAWLQPVVDLFADWAGNNPKLMRALVVARQAVEGVTMALGWLVDKAKAAWQAIRDFAEEQWEKLKNVWENVEEAWAEDIDPALKSVLEKFQELPGGVQIAFLGAAATMAGSMLAMLTVWTARMLGQFAVWTATSLKKMAVWTAKMLAHFAVWTLSTLASMALWPAKMLLHFAVWTVTSLIRMGVWVATMLVRQLVWEITSLARMAIWTAAMLAKMALWSARMLVKMVVWTTGMLAKMALWTVGMLVKMAIWTAATLASMTLWSTRMLIRMAIWAAGMVLSWAIAFGPVTLIVLAVAGLAAGAYLLIDNWESISARWRRLWGDLKVEAVDVLNAIIDKINALIRLWNSIPAVPDVGEIGMVTPPSRSTMSPEDAALDAAIREAWVVPGQQSPEPGNVLGSVADLLGHIPGFAAGGIVTGPTIARLGEEGPEVVAPLDKLERGLGGGLTIVFEGDIYGEDFNDRVRDAVDDATRRGVVFGAT